MTFIDSFGSFEFYVMLWDFYEILCGFMEICEILWDFMGFFGILLDCILFGSDSDNFSEKTQVACTSDGLVFTFASADLIGKFQVTEQCQFSIKVFARLSSRGRWGAFVPPNSPPACGVPLPSVGAPKPGAWEVFRGLANLAPALA